MSFPRALPAPRTPNPMEAPPLRWGILGTGWIAQRFCDAMLQHTRQRVVAVGSRTQQGADAFADDLVTRNAGVGTGSPVERAVPHGSYEALVADPDVDIVYVATLHHLHLPHGRLALEAGKATVVEKPMGLDRGEVAELQALASARRLFLMEAMWSAYLPKFDVIRQLLDDGALGAVHSVQADLGEHFGPEHRIMRADLFGGPRYDLLTYPLWFARWVLGDLDEVHETVTPAPTELSPDGVEGQIAVAARTAYNTVASLFATILGDTPTTATVVGSAATLRIDGPFYQPGGFALRAHDGRELRYDEPRIAHAGLHYEAAAAARAVAAGRLTAHQTHHQTTG
ncbi:Gfo/Idh/MocA family oxidoreductase [Terrabacter sp. NPDC080008]|uniref:Gfo/Idh/MocA family protein n=1 Tax=Terrabacter sp. NPDC080008 TaxID=3155176 RepID=UPI0034501A4C